MKRVLCLLAFSGALLWPADLAGVRTIYVMPMARGLDQHLASRIASEHVFQVVADPKLADAVLTDRIGESLQNQLETISPTPKPETEDAEEAEQPAAKADNEKSAKPSGKGKDEPADGTPSVISGMTNPTNKLDNLAAGSSFGRVKGAIFLVDAKSRLVVWSTYDPPRSSASGDLARSATDIVSRLKKDLNPKKK